MSLILLELLNGGTARDFAKTSSIDGYVLLKYLLTMDLRLGGQSRDKGMTSVSLMHVLRGGLRAFTTRIGLSWIYGRALGQVLVLDWLKD